MQTLFHTRGIFALTHKTKGPKHFPWSVSLNCVLAHSSPLGLSSLPKSRNLTVISLHPENQQGNFADRDLSRQSFRELIAGDTLLALENEILETLEDILIFIADLKDAQESVYLKSICAGSNKELN